jgi:hypothetical protein
VHVTIEKTHKVIIDEPAAEGKPIECCCSGIALHKNKVYACAPVRNLSMRFPEVEPKEYFCTDVCLHFLDKLEALVKGGTKYCYYCTDNWAVAKNLRLVSVYKPLGKSFKKTKEE